MAIFDFTGADGDPIPAGLDAHIGTFEIQNNKLQTQLPLALKPFYVCTYESGSPDVTVEAVLDSATQVYYGLTLRYININSFIVVNVQDNGDIALFTYVSGTYNKIASAPIPGYVAGNVYVIRATITGNDYVIDVNSDLGLINHTTAFWNTGTRHGLNFFQGNCNCDTLSVVTAGSSLLTIVNKENQCYQQINDARTITLEGQYVGGSGDIEYKINDGPWLLGGPLTGDDYSFNVELQRGKSLVSVRSAVDTFVNLLDLPQFVVDVYACSGQSNMSGRGDVNQTFIPGLSSTAIVQRNNDDFEVITDPWDIDDGITRAIAADTGGETPTGSFMPNFCSAFVADTNENICVSTNARGSKGMIPWQKTSTERIDGLNLYEAMAERIALTGGCHLNIFLGGEADMVEGTTKVQFKSLLNQFINDVYADFGVKTLLVAFCNYKSVLDGNGVTTGQVPLRAAQLEVAAENPNAIITVPMTDIDIIGGAGDGVHYLLTPDLQLVGQRVYDAVALFLVNTAPIDISGIPDGTYETVLIDGANREILFDGNAIYSSGVSNIPVRTDVGRRVIGSVYDNENPNVDGSAVEVLVV